jgi:hypothetical protein
MGKGKTGYPIRHYIPLTRENPHEQTINQKENNYNQITCKAAEKTVYLLSENCKHGILLHFRTE